MAVVSTEAIGARAHVGAILLMADTTVEARPLLTDVLQLCDDSRAALGLTCSGTYTDVTNNTWVAELTCTCTRKILERAMLTPALRACKNIIHVVA